MNTQRTTIVLLLSLLALSACDRQEMTTEGAGPIRFAGPVQTKVTDAASHTDRFEVRDWLNNSTYHINNTLAYNGSAWDYGTTPPTPGYIWKNGHHLFFGWLKDDDAYSTSSFFGPDFSLSETSPTLSLPTKTMNNSVRQYDFLYSYSVLRSTAENDYSDVPLIFRHLFAQIAISFKMSDGAGDSEAIVLKQVYLNNTFKNSKSATIDFSTGGTPAVTYDNVSAVGYFSTPQDFSSGIGASYTKASLPIDVLAQNPVASNEAKASYFVWPTPEADLKDVITIVYRLSSDPVGVDDRTTTMSFPEGTSWECGNKYSYTITYSSGVLKIVENVLPWEYRETAIPEVTAPSVTVMASWLGWDENSCSISGSDVSFITDGEGNPKPIRGMFKIYSPTECTYNIIMTDNAGKYTVTPASGTIGSGETDTAPGATIEFEISTTKANLPASGDPAITSGMTFTVEVSGRTYSLDSELQRDGAYNIIIPPSS